MKKILATLMIMATFSGTIATASAEYYLPGYFGQDKTVAAYQWIDEETIRQLRVALKTKPSGGLSSFGKPSKNFEMEYASAIEFGKSYGKFGAMSDYASKVMADPLAKDLFVTLGPTFLQREHGGNNEQNPRNQQGCYQILAIQELYNACSNYNDYNRSSLFECSEVKKAYEPMRLLSAEEKNIQTLDTLWFLYRKFRDMNKVLNGDFQEPRSYKANSLIFLKALFGNRYSEEELKSYASAIQSKKVGELAPLFAKEAEGLSTVGIDEPQDFTKWLDYVRVGYFGASYNGWGNNYGYKQTRKLSGIYNVLDHSYASNYPEYDILFYNIKKDGGGIGSTPDRNPGMVPIFLKSFDDGDARGAEFAALLTVLQKNGDLPMTKK